MRKLATIRPITNFRPIEGKDKIEQARVDGWNLIVKKNEFKEGDLCVYIEIDSVLPETSDFEFLRNKDFRIKTMKMSGVLSQGIAFPLSILPSGYKYKEGQDVTDVLGIKEYEGSMDDGGNNNQKHKKRPKFLMKYSWFRKLFLPKKEYKGFPKFISITDETRIQNAPSYLKDKNQKWVLTEKVDGCSSTYVLEKKSGLFGKQKLEYYVCSHRCRLDPNQKTPPIWEASKKNNVENFLKQFISTNEDWKWVAIQGECVAPKVQGNKYKVDSPDLYVFNLITPDGRYGSLEAKKIVENAGLKFVPIVSEGAILPDTVDEMLQLAHGNSAIGTTLREGLVCRTIDGKQSFKAVDPLFLLKYNE